MTPQERVAQLLAEFDHPGVCLAEQLCDRHDGDAVAFTFMQPDLSSADLTYAELRERSGEVAAALAEFGVEPGERVVTLMARSEDLVVVLLGIWRAGAVHVPLFTALAPPSVRLRLEAAEARVVFCDAAQRPKLDYRPPGEPEDTPPSWRIVQVGGEVPPGKHRLDRLRRKARTEAWPVPEMEGDGDTEFIRIYTSGTTGTPKGVPVTYKAVAGFQVYLEYALGIGPDDVFWVATDPSFPYGLYYAVIAPLAAGRRSLMLCSGYESKLTWQVLAKFGITDVSTTPTAYRAMERSVRKRAMPRGLRLRRLTSCSEPLTQDVVAWAKRDLNINVHNTYGQTELGMCVADGWHPDVAAPWKTGSIGRPLPGWSLVALSPEGERLPAGQTGRLAVDIEASPGMWFIGYVDAPEQTRERFTEDGRWYLTGDAGRLDEDGTLFFAARDDDVIITSGYRVGPAEVESVLTADPRVEEAAVVGVPDMMRGQVIEAFVVLARDVPLAEGLEESLQEKVKSELAAHIVPRSVHVLAELPKSSTGRVQRFVLRELHTLPPVAAPAVRFPERA